MTPESLLRQWLQSRLSPESVQWLDEAAGRCMKESGDGELYLAFSLAPRKTGKAALALANGEAQAALAARDGWRTDGWRVDEAARLWLLLRTGGDAKRLARRVDQLCATADVGELVTLYRGLPLYPEPERYRLRAAEGIRTSMRVVFEAVAHCNPYPMEQLAAEAWNQMVLKALFVGSTLDPIVGLEKRANSTLARMLCDYAHERWSAGRPVSPELWRCVGPFADEPMRADVARVLEKGSAAEQAAAALALRSCADPQAAVLLRAARPELVDALARGELSWQALAVTTPS